MNLKKCLQKQAEKDAEIFLDEDDELFIKELIQNDSSIAEVQSKRSKKFWTCIASLVTVVVAAVIIFPSVFVNRGGDNIFYKDDDIVEVTCQLEEVQQNTKYFQINNSAQTLNNFTLKYDRVTNDKLFYTIEGLSVLSNYKFYIVINNKYNFKFEMDEELNVKPLTEYSLNYVVYLSDGIDMAGARYLGYISLNTEIIYFEYEQVIVPDEKAFFDDIESIIKVKN